MLVVPLSQAASNIGACSDTKDAHESSGEDHSYGVTVDGPPSLPFNLRQHKTSIVLFWTLIAAEVCLIPISFYYGLWFGTNLNHGALFAIITSVFGFVSGYEYGLRAFHLTRPDPKYRPIGSGRWQFDATQITLAVPYTVMTAVLVGFSIPYEPVVRGLATPFALADTILGTIFILSAFAFTRGWRTPVRLSSTAPGELCPPFAYIVMEDVVCVDGRCPEFRVAVQERWKASPIFRKLLVNITWLWGITSVLVGVSVLTVVGTVNEVMGYGIGWGVPSLHAGVCTVVTFYWADEALKEEKRSWGVQSLHPDSTVADMDRCTDPAVVIDRLG